jgi:serine/threonine protein kinase
MRCPAARPCWASGPRVFGALLPVLGFLLLAVATEGVAQTPPSRLEVRIDPPEEGVRVEALGTGIARTTDAAGVAVLAVPSGFLELEFTDPFGEVERGTLVVPEGVMVHRVTLQGLRERRDREALAREGAGSRDPVAPVRPGEVEEEREAGRAGDGSSAPVDSDASLDLAEEHGDSLELGSARGPERGDLRGEELAPDPGSGLHAEQGGDPDDPDPRLSLPWLLGLVVLPAAVGGAFALRKQGRPNFDPEAPTQAWEPVAAGGRPVETFLEYELSEVLGRGGMATVWRACSPEGDPLALKVMNPELSDDPVLRRKFLREGAVLGRIQECWPEAPVVRVLAWGPREESETAGEGAEDPERPVTPEEAGEEGRSEADDATPPWVALELLEGRTLMHYLRDPTRRGSPFSSAGILHLARQVAEGLRAAHDCGIYHRDLSPDNILLLDEDPDRPTVRLIDFGVARHEFTQVHTLDGSIFGKPPYMAPEQGLGNVVDGRADFYSLGVILYLLLEGRTPFSDPNPLLVLKMHAEDPVPPLGTDHPRPLVNIVMKLLEKDPDRRPADADACLLKLDVVIDDLDH